jgi:hypothetical protein
MHDDDVPGEEATSAAADFEPASNSLPSTIIPDSAHRSSTLLNAPPATMLCKRLNILYSNIILHSEEAPTPHIGKGRSSATVKGLRA